MDITLKIGTDILINLPIESLKVVIQKQQEELGKAFILRDKQIIEVISAEFETWFTATSALKTESPKKIFTDLIALQSKMVSGVIKVEPENQATTSRNNLNGNEQNIVKRSRLRDVPSFSGSNDGYIDEWLYLVENGAKISGIPIEDLVSEVIPFLRGSVLQTTIQLKKANANLSWDEFKKNLQEIFIPGNIQRKLRTELKSIRFGYDFENRLLHFQLILGRIKEMPDIEAYYIFMDALPHWISKELTLRRVTTFKEAFRDARLIYEEEKINKLNSRPEFVNVVKKEYINTSLKCFRCKKPGHFKKDCREKKRVEKTYTALEILSDTETSDRKSEYVYVGSAGSLLGVEGLINGTKVNFLLDTGASKSIISLQKAIKEDLKILPCDMMIGTASKSVKAVGLTEKIRIDVNGFVCELEFIVLDTCHEIILGLDWFKTVDAGIIPSKNQLFFINRGCIKSFQLISLVNERKNNKEFVLFSYDLTTGAIIIILNVVILIVILVLAGFFSKKLSRKFKKVRINQGKLLTVILEVKDLEIIDNKVVNKSNSHQQKQKEKHEEFNLSEYKIINLKEQEKKNFE